MVGGERVAWVESTAAPPKDSCYASSSCFATKAADGSGEHLKLVMLAYTVQPVRTSGN